MGNEMMELKMGTGSQQQAIMAHKKRLCNRIPYFNKVFSKPGNKSSKGWAEFPEEDPINMDVLLEWVSFGMLRCVRIIRILF